MLTGTWRGALGDFRSDFVAAMTPFVGATKANELMVGAETLVKSKAKEGVEAALPKVKTEVQHVVLPLFVGAATLGALGTIFSVAALIKLKRRG